jgi:diguanylate cyclase (GGDEF)-like protein
MELKKDSLFDEMRIYNRNTFNNLAWKLVDIEKREEKNCSFLMIDFDHFKQVNDQYGHHTGDEALKQLVNTIKNIIRESDVLFRYGGEEFVVFLPNTDVAGAKEIAEKIRKGVQSQAINIKDKNEQKLQLKKTITIGCASMNQIKDKKDGHGEEVNKELVEKILGLADKALYKGKQEGRNRVVTNEIRERNNYPVDYSEKRAKK